MKLASLNSWKEIAVYLDRGVRTVQRWERELELPVHRIGHGSRSPVQAFPSELQAWLLRVGSNHRGMAATDARNPHLSHPDGTVATSRVLVRRSSTLVKQMMDSLWIQRQRAEALVEMLNQFCDKIGARKKADSAPSPRWHHPTRIKPAPRPKRRSRRNARYAQ